jgi:hypothetical protein
MRDKAMAGPFIVLAILVLVVLIGFGCAIANG